MDINKICSLLVADKINVKDYNINITNGYSCDLLSNVYCKSLDNYVWFTVMNNGNVCAVADKSKVALVVLCENIYPDEQLLFNVKKYGINLVVTKFDSYTAIKLLSQYIDTEH